MEGISVEHHPQLQSDNCIKKEKNINFTKYNRPKDKVLIYKIFYEHYIVHIRDTSIDKKTAIKNKQKGSHKSITTVRTPDLNEDNFNPYNQTVRLSKLK